MDVDDEESLGRVILYRARIHGITKLNNKSLSQDDRKHIFLEVFNKAAQDKGYKDFYSLPQGTKDFIYKRGQAARREYEVPASVPAKGQLALPGI